MKKKKNNTFKNLKKMYPYAKKYKKFLIGYIIAGIIFCIINVIIPIFSAKIVLDISNNLLTDLLTVAFAILILNIVSSLCTFFSSRMQQKFYYKAITDIELNLINDTFSLKKSEIDKHTSGVFIDRLTKDTENLADVFGNIIFYLTQFFQSFGVLIAILVINRYMFLYFCILLVIIYFVEKARTSNWYESTKEYRELNEKNSGLISEIIRGMTDIKVLNSNKRFFEAVGNKLEESNKKNDKINSTMMKYIFASNFIQHIFTFLFFVTGVFLVSIKNLSISNFLIIYMYKDRVYGLVEAISALLSSMKQFSLSAERIFEISDGTFEVEKFGKVHLDKVKGNFEFKNVTFGYDKNKPIIKDMSFKINSNETVAFIGKSGSGKSTIFSLLDKLYTVDQGEILIDDININKLDKSSIRDNISIINQSPYIFNFSIKENLSLVKKDATMEEIVEVCKIAKLHDYIMTLPDGYDTLVGESGVMLSGGQKQRLAIARALLKKTEIILFDEATSALDNETQKEIQEAINSMKGEYTILIIAHRLSTVIGSDRIFVIDDGEKVAEGSHKELMATNELYKKLYKTELKQS